MDDSIFNKAYRLPEDYDINYSMMSLALKWMGCIAWKGPRMYRTMERHFTYPLVASTVSVISRGSFSSSSPHFLLPAIRSKSQVQGPLPLILEPESCIWTYAGHPSSTNASHS
jgi:hypothetical protein